MNATFRSFMEKWASAERVARRHLAGNLVGVHVDSTREIVEVVEWVEEQADYNYGGHNAGFTVYDGNRKVYG